MIGGSALRSAGGAANMRRTSAAAKHSTPPTVARFPPTVAMPLKRN